MQKSISILLSLLMLCSSTGIAYGQHFCGEHLITSSVTLTQAVESCGMEQHQKPPCEKNSHELHQENCCDNILHQVQTDDNYNGGNPLQLEIHKSFALALVSVFVLYRLEETTHTKTLTEYFPPPLRKDIPVLFQTFLI